MHHSKVGKQLLVGYISTCSFSLKSYCRSTAFLYFTIPLHGFCFLYTEKKRGWRRWIMYQKMRIASTGVCKSILKALKNVLFFFYNYGNKLFHIKLVVKKVFSAGHFNFSHLHIHGYNIIALKNHLLVGFTLHKYHLYNVLKSEWFCAII